MSTRAIAVGTDGTGAGGDAVRCAAREAVRRHLPLHIVHAFDWQWDAARYESGSEHIDVARHLADAVVAAAVEQAWAVAPELSVTTKTVVGEAVPRLLEAAGEAELMVLGTRGRGGFAGLMLGSVSQRIAAHAPCPVIVVRGHTEANRGPVVVGVDDSPAAELVLATAFDAAAARDSALAVVRAYVPFAPLWIGDIPAAAIDTPQQDVEQHARLDDLVAPWQEKYPQVPVHTVISRNSAAAVLTRVSRSAQLVIVGSHGRGALASALLGSTGMQLIHQAECPVLITRPVPVSSTVTRR
jgi:nucleotide-binding universal stress UspA family protein